MLNPKSDRSNYGMLLHAPDGYRLRNAICTTYSMDLETLMASVIALSLNEETDSELRHPLNDLHAIRSVADKLIVFCEAGQIVAPTHSSTLLTLLENMVVEVALKKVGTQKYYPSFHPKTWIILYDNDEGDIWGRFIVMSRNLTTDRSWDVSVMIEGKSSNKKEEKNLPLVDFVSFLQTFVKDHKDRNERILKDIKKYISSLEFKVDDPFSGYDIIPMGYKNSAKMTEKDLWLKEPSELLIVSPFLDKETIAHWNSWNNTQMKLVTRVTELDSIRDCHENMEVYTLRTEIVEGERNIPEIVDSDDKSILREDIHSKMYFWHKGEDKRLYVGSMNASHRGLNVNCEMMLALYSNRGTVSLNKLWTEMANTDKKDSPFELVDWNLLIDDEKEVDEREQLAQDIKTLCRCSLVANVLNNGGEYDVKILSEDTIPTNITIASMLAPNNKQNLNKETTIKGLKELELSEFYIVTAHGNTQNVSKLIRISTTPMPENRKEMILTNYLDKPEKFIRYIGLVLAGNDSYNQSCQLNAILNTNQTKGGVTTQAPALYEQLLKASVYNPEQINEIAEIVAQIKSGDIITKEFRDMFAMFYDKEGVRHGNK